MAASDPYGAEVVAAVENAIADEPLGVPMPLNMVNNSSSASLHSVPQETDKEGGVQLTQHSNASDEQSAGHEKDEVAVDAPSKEGPPQNPAPPEPITGWKLTSTMAALTFVFLLVFLDISIISTAIPVITNDFHALHDVGWYGSAYLLAGCALQPMAGKLYTYFPLKTVFLIFFGIFELGSLLCGVASSSTMFIIGRAVAGMGSAGLINGGLTIIAAAAPIDKRPKLIGLVLGCGQVGIMCGPIISGAFTEKVTWRWCFYLNLPPGALIAAVLIPMSLPNGLSRRTPDDTWRTILRKLDLPGFVIFSGAAIMVLVALQWGGNEYAWGSATVIGLFCGGGVVFIIFLVWEHWVGEEAMIPLSMVTRRIVWCSLLVAFFFMGNALIFVYFLAIYFQSVRNVTPIISGVSFLPGILSQVFALVFSGIYVTRIGYYLPFSVVGGALSTIGNGLFTMLNPTTPTGNWIGYQIVGGVGRGLGMQMSVLAVQNDLPPNQVAMGTALLILVQNLGGAIFLAIGNTILDVTLSNTLNDDLSPELTGKIIRAGASNWRKVVDVADVPIVQNAYTVGLRNTFFLAVACGILLVIASFGIGWKRIGKKKAEPEKAAATKDVEA